MARRSSAVVAWLAAVTGVGLSQSCNRVGSYPVNTCLRSNTDNNESMMFVCDSSSGYANVWSWTGSHYCDGYGYTISSTEGMDEYADQVCDGDVDCDYLDYQRRFFDGNSSCDWEALLTRSYYYKVQDTCINGTTLYNCTDDSSTGFAICDCDGNCEVQDMYQFGVCDETDIDAPFQDEFDDCGETPDPPPNAEYSCNFYAANPINVCMEESFEFSKKWTCVDGTPYRTEYNASADCTGPSVTLDATDWDDEYECDADTDCDYLRYSTTYYQTDDCTGDSETFYEYFSIDHCSYDSLYFCNEAEDQYYECDCSHTGYVDEDSCEASSRDWDVCQVDESDGDSQVYSLERCPYSGLAPTVSPTVAAEDGDSDADGGDSGAASSPTALVAQFAVALSLLFIVSV